MACSLTRIVRFTATHHYAVQGWSAEKNAAVFGSTARPHHHDYQCAVTVRGTPDPVTGLVVDLVHFDTVLREEVIDRYEGRDLNADPSFSGGRTLPSGEALCMDIWRRVEPRLTDGCRLEAVRVQENETIYAEYRGD